MKEASFTQTRAAEVLGLYQENVSRRVRGKTPWRAEELAKLAAAMDVPVERFFPAADGSAPAEGLQATPTSQSA